MRGVKKYNKMSKDNIFQKKIDKQFQFDENVASVFDDMLNRSVPFYNENLDLIVQIIEKYIKENEQILDLGCSTASLLLTIEKKINKKAITEFLPMQPGDVEQTSADISKSTKMLGYNPRTDFEEGISKFIEWLQNEDFNIFK